MFHSREGTLKTQTAGRMIQVTGQASRNLRRVREALERLPNPKAAAVAWLGRLAKQAHPPPRRPPCRLPASQPARRRRPCLHCSRQNRAASFVARSRLPPPPEPGLEREREREKEGERPPRSLCLSLHPDKAARRERAHLLRRHSHSVPIRASLGRRAGRRRQLPTESRGGSCRRRRGRRRQRRTRPSAGPTDRPFANITDLLPAAAAAAPAPLPASPPRDSRSCELEPG